jgi:imidazolonepropionase-like amidohydrolase
MSLTAIFNCDLFTPGEQIPQGLVLVEGSHIRLVGRSHEIPLPADTRLLDAQGGRVTPGLIDLGGMDSSNNKVEAQGITSYLLRASARDERDLQRISQAAASLPSPAGSAVVRFWWRERHRRVF